MSDYRLTVSRRSVLASLGAVPLSACVPKVTDVARRRVVVVGAGLAGLAAAYELTQAGLDVRVLEQSDRPGGRVYTVRDHFSDGDITELGGAEVSSSYGNFVNYCNQFKVGLEASVRDAARKDVLLYEKDQLFSVGALRGKEEWPIPLEASERKVVPFGLLGLYLSPVAKQIATLDRLLTAEFAYLDDMTLRQLLGEQGASPAAIEFIDRTLNYNSVDSVSALGALRDQLRRMSAGGGTGLKIANGNSTLPEAFARQLGDRLFYGTSLAALENGPDLIKLRVVTSSGEENWECEHLVVAIPFTALRRVTIDGNLPADRRAMIEELPYTQVSRTYLQTSNRFWELDGAVAAIYTDGPLERFFDVSDADSGERGLLQNWINGVGVDSIQGMDDQERVSFIVEKMHDIWPRAANAIQQSLSVDWGETYCQGAYAHFAPGQIQRFARTVAEPLGRLHFAGEHTEFRSPGLEGALVSGRRAAQDVLDSV